MKRIWWLIVNREPARAHAAIIVSIAARL